jgi:RHS repeat-associated protein
MPTTNYIWDEENLLAEADGTDTIQTVYTNEPEQYGNLVSTRLPVGGTPTSVYHHFDALGSTRQLTNAAGSVTDTVIYDAWGSVVKRTGSTPIALQWLGEVQYYFELETGQFYVRERIYGPVVARWTAPDPSGFIDGANLYIYAANSSAVVTDPSGELCRKRVFTVVGAGYAPLSHQGHLDDCIINAFGPGMFQYGQTFHVIAKFVNEGQYHCCCCEFRQYVTGTMRRRFRHKDKNSGDIVPNDDGWTVVRQYGELQEDIGPAGERYGHRSDPQATGDIYYPLGFRKTGCDYISNDTPGINMTKYWREMVFAKSAYLEMEIHARFVLNIQDFCDHGRVVDSMTIDMDCCSLLQLNGRPILAKPAVTAAAKPKCGG